MSPSAHFRAGFGALSLTLAVAASAVAQDAAGPPLHVVEIGSGETTIVVLHGGPATRHNYLRPEWDRLADVGRVVYYDQRGCGMSMRVGPYTWDQHVRDLHDLLETLRPAGPVVLAGSSWGSVLALLYAHSHPEHIAGLVLSGLAEGLWDDADDRAWREAALRMPRRAGVELVRDSVTVANRNPSPLSQRMGEACIAVRNATLESFRTTAPLRESLRDVRVPTLIFRGLTPDTPGDASVDFADVLTDSRVVPLTAGHDPWFEQPDLFFTAAKKFIVGL